MGVTTKRDPGDDLDKKFIGKIEKVDHFSRDTWRSVVELLKSNRLYTS